MRPPAWLAPALRMGDRLRHGPRTSIVSFVSGIAGPAFAHPGHAELGFLHPLTGPDHRAGHDRRRHVGGLPVERASRPPPSGRAGRLHGHDGVWGSCRIRGHQTALLGGGHDRLDFHAGRPCPGRRPGADSPPPCWWSAGSPSCTAIPTPLRPRPATPAAICWASWPPPPCSRRVGLGLGWVVQRLIGNLGLRALGGLVMAGGALVLATH